MATNKSCEECDKEFVARNINHRFCTDECRVEWWSQEKMSTELLTCEVCNTEFKGTIGRKYCDQFCRDVALATFKQKVSDEDIVYLILLNPGCGIERLRKELAKFLGQKKKSHGVSKTRIVDVCEYYKLESGVDLYSILQNPDYMQSVHAGDYLRKTGKKYLPPGQGINTGNRTALKHYRNGSMSGLKGHARHVRVDLREFNWGRLAQSED